jgi:acyl carrier protein
VTRRYHPRKFSLATTVVELLAGNELSSGSIAFHVQSSSLEKKVQFMDIESRIKKIILSNVDVPESELVPEAKLRSDLGATSIDVVEMVATLESEFDIDISDEDAQNVRTYGEMVAYVKSKVS